MRLARSFLLAGLSPEAAPPPRIRAPGAMVLRVLVEEFERAVREELGPQAPAPRPASGEEPGNVAAAVLRWLRAVADGANVPLASLRGAAEQAIERTRESLAEEAAPPAATEELDKARDVLLRAIGREGRSAESTPVPTFRPDLPVMAVSARAGTRRAATKGRRSGLEDAPTEGEADADFPAEEPENPPAAVDLKGPMELIRRYLDDFLSQVPGACARHFVYPACRWQGGRWQAYADGPALRAAFEARHRELAGRGVSGGKILMLRAEPLGPAIATVRALLGREGGPVDPVQEVEVAYTTVLTPGGWRIAVLMLP